MATGYLVNGTDLSSIFKPLVGAPGPATGYLVNGADLNTIFLPLGHATPRANTGYKANEGAPTDLSSLFAPI